MTDWVANLNGMLATMGESIVLRRPGGMDVTCQAVVRGYAPSEMVTGSGITQQSQKIIIGPSEIIAAGWPGGSGPGDIRVPANGDRVLSSRGALRVESAVGFYVEGELVRIEMIVKGA